MWCVESVDCFHIHICRVASHMWYLSILTAVAGCERKCYRLQESFPLHVKCLAVILHLEALCFVPLKYFHAYHFSTSLELKNYSTIFLMDILIKAYLTEELFDLHNHIKDTSSD